MDIATILADVQLAIKLGKLAYDTGVDAAPFVMTAYNILFKGKVLTAEERAAMVAKEQSMRAGIDAQIAEDEKTED